MAKTTKQRPLKRMRKSPKRYDPTRTGLIRRKFEADIKRRFAQLRREVWELLTKDGEELGATELTLNAKQSWTWAAASSPAETVEKFRTWLLARMDSLILERRGIRDEEGHWTDDYVDTAYFKGAGHAVDYLDRRAAEHRLSRRPTRGRRTGAAGRVLPSEKPTAQSVLSTLKGMLQAPVNLNKVKLIQGRTFEQLKNINQSMATQLANTLSDGLVRGDSPRTVARIISKEIEGITKKRAVTIARTETIRAHAEGSLDSLELMGVTEVGVEVEWQATMIDEDAGIFEERVCPRCQEMAGTVMPIAAAHGLIPFHPNCVVGTTRVSSTGQINAVSKRWFEGYVFVIRTATNRELTCTPNHPILTDLGWIAAQSLHVGGNVVSDGRREWMASTRTHDQNIPPLIHDVSETFGRTFGVGSYEMPVTSPDFHGDGFGSKVAVIRSKSELRYGYDFTLPQHSLKESLVVGNVVGSSLYGSSPGALLLERHNPSSDRIVGSGGYPQTFFGSTLGSLNPLDLTHRHQLYSIGNQHVTNDLSSDSVAGGQLQNVDSFSVLFDQSRHQRSGQSVSIQAMGNEIVSNDSTHLSVADSVLAAEILNGGSGPVFLDKIVGIERQRFSGYVYNLDTECGFYTADGIVTHNCRCAWVPSL